MQFPAKNNNGNTETVHNETAAVPMMEMPKGLAIIFENVPEDMRHELTRHLHKEARKYVMQQEAEEIRRKLEAAGYEVTRKPTKEELLEKEIERLQDAFGEELKTRSRMLRECADETNKASAVSGVVGALLGAIISAIAINKSEE